MCVPDHIHTPLLHLEQLIQAQMKMTMYVLMDMMDADPVQILNLNMMSILMLNPRMRNLILIQSVIM